MNNIYLEDVNIEGFKSFSEETNMSFQPGIGVIIGNNGVGKSNILDAIVWALGENDLGRIRCYEKEELFFAGSKDYPPASKIRVELLLKQGEKKDAPGIRLARERTKNGEDQYWIDKTSYAREAYRQKLDAYNLRHCLETIIRQEQINDVIQLNPWQRFDYIRQILGIESKEEIEKMGVDKFISLPLQFKVYFFEKNVSLEFIILKISFIKVIKKLIAKFWIKLLSGYEVYSNRRIRCFR